MQQRIIADNLVINTEEQAIQEIMYRLLYLQIHAKPGTKNFTCFVEELLENKLIIYNHKLRQNTNLFQVGSRELEYFSNISAILLIKSKPVLSNTGA